MSAKRGRSLMVGRRRVDRRWPRPNEIPLRKGAVMKSKVSTVKSIAMIVALVAGVSGVARADDNSMSIWTGDSYAAFNGGKDFPYGHPALHPAPAASTPR